jgi:heavy metal sensor kinase
MAFPENQDTAIPVIAKTDTLKEHTLPLSEKASQALQANEQIVETISGVFHFPLRVMTFSAHDKNQQPYILQIGLSLYDIQTELNDLLLIFAVSFPALLVVVSILGYMFMKGAFSPVKRMVAVARRITAEDLSLRLDPLHSHDEIGELASTLNEMISRLEQSFNQMQQFSADVSHELKTPLAKLKCHAEVTLRRERTGEEYQHVLTKMIEDLEKLQHIIDNLFFLVRMDARHIPLSFIPLALQDVFFMVFEELQPLATKKAVGIVFEDIEPVTFEGDLGLLKRVFTNLLLNAIQYTPSGGRMIVSLCQDADDGILTITDTGIGIPKKALPHIFDRFYRADPSRSYETGGSGLGLAIAQKSVEFHGGSISVQSEEGHGTTFRVSLPCSL